MAAVSSRSTMTGRLLVVLALTGAVLVAAVPRDGRNAIIDGPGCCDERDQFCAKGNGDDNDLCKSMRTCQMSDPSDGSVAASCLLTTGTKYTAYACDFSTCEDEVLAFCDDDSQANCEAYSDCTGQPILCGSSSSLEAAHARACKDNGDCQDEIDKWCENDNDDTCGAYFQCRGEVAACPASDHESTSERRAFVCGTCSSERGWFCYYFTNAGTAKEAAESDAFVNACNKYHACAYGDSEDSRYDFCAGENIDYANFNNGICSCRQVWYKNWVLGLIGALTFVLVASACFCGYKAKRK